MLEDLMSTMSEAREEVYPGHWKRMQHATHHQVCGCFGIDMDHTTATIVDPGVERFHLSLWLHQFHRSTQITAGKCASKKLLYAPCSVKPLSMRLANSAGKSVKR